jgi:hypothetical protein
MLDDKIPDAILPSQFCEESALLADAPGEHRLLLAVLKDAIHIYCTAGASWRRRNQRRFREVEEWFGSDDRQWLFSFERICEALDLDPQYLRRGLRTWRQRAVPEYLVLMANAHAGLGR